MAGIGGLLGAFALILAGVAFVAESVAVARERVAARIMLVRKPSGAPRMLPPPVEGFRAFVTGLPREEREAVRQLRRLGFSPEIALSFYRIARPFLAIALGGVVLLVAPYFAPLRLAVLLALGAALGVWLAPSAMLRRAVRTRAAQAAAGLPDALELLVVCIEAGLSLEDGIDRVVRELSASQPFLAEELALTSADWKILPSQEQALMNLAERVDVPSVHAFVTTLSQTLRYGTPLAQALRNVAIELRDDALLRIEERANELSVLLTVPMMLFIMPTIFLIVAGPAALRIFDIFLRGRMY